MKKIKSYTVEDIAMYLQENESCWPVAVYLNEPRIYYSVWMDRNGYLLSDMETDKTDVRFDTFVTDDVLLEELGYETPLELDEGEEYPLTMDVIYSMEDMSYSHFKRVVEDLCYQVNAWLQEKH